MRLCGREALHSANRNNKIIFTEWHASIEYFSHSDELTVYSWDGISRDCTSKTITLPKNVHIVSIDCMTIALQSIDQRKRSSEIFAIGASDGKCYIMHKSGRAERVIEAHKGAVMNTKWNFDGTSLLTSGEDGILKIWSRSGMLRSTHAQTDSPIYSAVWSPFSTGVLYSSGKVLTIQPFAANSKTLQWKAHDSVVLVAAWCPVTNLIASGGEDCRFKIWDSLGQLLFDSSPQVHPIASITYSADGTHWAFSTFSCVCVTSSHGGELVELNVSQNGISSVCWSPDGSQLAVGNSSGSMQIFHLIRSSISWANYTVSMKSPNTLELTDDMSEAVETLDFKDDIVLWSFKYGHLLLASRSQLLIHKENNWHSPLTLELRDKSPQFIKQTEKYFLVADAGILYVYSYDGALQGTPRLSNQRLLGLTPDYVTSAREIIAIRTLNDGKSVYCVNYRTGKPLYGDKPLAHTNTISKLELDPCSPPGDQLIALLDASRDLHLLCLPTGSNNMNKMRSPIKIASSVTSFEWSSDCSMLAFVRDEELCIVPYPPAVPDDLTLLDKFVTRQNVREYGRNAMIESFNGRRVSLRRGDGVSLPICISPYPHQLQRYVSSGQWESAQRLCSSIKSELLWLCLAAMAIHYKQLDAAQVAFVALRETDKILFIDAIKKMNNVAMIKAETALLQNGTAEAEAILLQAGLPLKAIMLNLQLFHFERALDLAIKHDSNIDVVIAYRRKYLEQFGWSENMQRFIEYAKKVDIDWDTIEERLVDEL